MFSCGCGGRKPPCLTRWVNLHPIFGQRVTIVNTLRPYVTMLSCQAILASIRVLLALCFGL